MKIHVYSIMRNERKMLPFYFDHYLKYASKFVIFDDESDDGTIEYIHQQAISLHIRGIAVERRPMPETMLDDGLSAKVFSEAYRTDRSADYVFCVDADEFIYADDLINRLTVAKEKGVQVIIANGYEMKSLEFPDYYSPITEQIKAGNEWHGATKPCIFSPDIDIKFGCGRHMIFGEKNYRKQHNDEIKLLHYRDMSYEYYKWHHDRNALRLSPKRADQTWGQHNFQPLREDEFAEHVSKAVKVI